MSELSEAINEMRNMREAYDQLGAAAEAYNTGKTELAANITAKGVPASADETLPELAEKVSVIAQETYEINGGEMYAKQLFGSLETPNYWNLYEVLAQLLSDGRLVQYGGILLAEYYKGYDSLALAGAGSGGAYVVSDMEDGQFKMYTEDTTHVWDTAFDGKGNRWVAYCFADEYHDFQITDTNTSPRSIFIGRKVGTITALTTHRLSQLVVTDGNELGGFVGNSYESSWDKRVVLRLGRLAANNSTSIGWTNSAIRSANIESLYIDADIVSPPIASRECTNLSTVILRGNFSNMSYMIAAPNLKTFIYTPKDGNAWLQIFNTTSFQDLIIYDIERAAYVTGSDCGFICSQMGNLYLNYKNNDKSLTVNARIRINSSAFMTSLQRLVLKNGWCKPLIADTNTSLSEENIYTYILQRLKQDEPDCGDGVTITLGSTNLAKLTSEESVQLLDDLTNIYGYTFA